MAPASVALTLAGVLAPGSRSLPPTALALSLGALAIGYRHLSEPQTAGNLLSAFWVAQVLWTALVSQSTLPRAGALAALCLGLLFVRALGRDYRLPGRGPTERLDWLLEVTATALTVGLPLAVLILVPDHGSPLAGFGQVGLLLGLLIRLRALRTRRLFLLPAFGTGAETPGRRWTGLAAGARWAAALSGAALGIPMVAAWWAVSLSSDRWVWAAALLASVLAALPGRWLLQPARERARTGHSLTKAGGGPHRRLVR